MRTLLLALFGMALLEGVPACPDLPCHGARITSAFKGTAFCVPGEMRMEESVGSHGDVHYTISFRGQMMRMTSGFYFFAKEPSEFDASWKLREWRSQGAKGRDHRRVEGGRHSRYITLEILGWIEYTNAPADIARTFDGVMDSMCLWPPKKQ